MKFLVTIHKDEDGVVIAECPAITGCVSQGQSEAEAEANVVDAITLIGRAGLTVEEFVAAIG